jgi:hypothetical protein
MLLRKSGASPDFPIVQRTAGRANNFAGLAASHWEELWSSQQNFLEGVNANIGQPFSLTEGRRRFIHL